MKQFSFPTDTTNNQPTKIRPTKQCIATAYKLLYTIKTDNTLSSIQSSDKLLQKATLYHNAVCYITYWLLQACTYMLVLVVGIQESCAIAKMTARCSLCMSVMKVFETPDYSYGYFSQIVLMLFYSDRLYKCA